MERSRTLRELFLDMFRIGGRNFLKMFALTGPFMGLAALIICLSEASLLGMAQTPPTALPGMEHRPIFLPVRPFWGRLFCSFCRPLSGPITIRLPFPAWAEKTSPSGRACAGRDGRFCAWCSTAVPCSAALCGGVYTSSAGRAQLNGGGPCRSADSLVLFPDRDCDSSLDHLAWPCICRVAFLVCHASYAIHRALRVSGNFQKHRDILSGTVWPQPGAYSPFESLRRGLCLCWDAAHGDRRIFLARGRRIFLDRSFSHDAGPWRCDAVFGCGKLHGLSERQARCGRQRGRKAGGFLERIGRAISAEGLVPQKKNSSRKAGEIG